MLDDFSSFIASVKVPTSPEASSIMNDQPQNNTMNRSAKLRNHVENLDEQGCPQDCRGDDRSKACCRRIVFLPHSYQAMPDPDNQYELTKTEGLGIALFVSALVGLGVVGGLALAKLLPNIFS